jgi:hypothetical protein
MAYSFTDAQLSLRTAGCGALLLVVAGHYQIPIVVITRAKRVIRYSSSKIYFGNCRMPRLSRGITGWFEIRSSRKIWTYNERWIVSTR